MQSISSIKSQIGIQTSHPLHVTQPYQQELTAYFFNLMQTKNSSTPFPNPQPSKFLSEILPYKTETKFKSQMRLALQEYSLLLKGITNTYKALKEGNLLAFDALVGENFCQSRALIITLTACHCLNSLKLKMNQVKEILGRINEILLNDNKWFKTSKLTFKKLLSDNLEIAFTDNELFFLQCYFLTLVKVESIADNLFCHAEETDPNQLQKLSPVASQFCRTLVKRLRENLADSSVQYVKELSLLSPDDMDIQMVSELYTVMSGKLKTLPFFRSTKIIMESAFKQRTRVVLEVFLKQNDNFIGNVSLYFEATEHGYKEKKPTLADANFDVFVIQGVAYRDGNHKFPSKQRLKRMLLQRGTFEIMAANTASHRQYLDPLKDSNLKHDPLLSFYKGKAKEWGCSRESPSLCAVQHVFCSKIKSLNSFQHFNCDYKLFYQTCFIKEIKECFNSNLTNITLIGSKIHIKIDPYINELEECKKKVSELLDKKFCYMLKPKLDKESFILDHGTQLEIDAEFNDDFLFCADILKVASQRTDPIEFLWENRLHWNINAGRAINYLISEPQFFDKYPAIEFLREIIFLNQFDFIVQELAIIGLGKALNISEFKEKAKSALIDIATTNNVHHLFIDELKLCAQEQLRPLLPEEDIQALFQQIAFKNNLYARSIDFLTSQPVVFDDSMIEFLKRIILLDAYDFNAQEQAIIGLGKALKLPKFKEKAKSALMDIAVPESVNNMYTDELRLCAQEQLRSLLHEEDIQMFFQQLAQANHC